MPNTKSAKKRLRQSVERRDRNRAERSTMRNQMRRVRDAVKAGEFAKAEEEFRAAVRQLDRAGAKNLIHKNKAARTKSRLSRMIKVAKEAAAG